MRVNICEIENELRNINRVDFLYQESESMYEWNVRIFDDKVLDFIGLHNFDIKEFIIQSHEKMRIVRKRSEKN